MNGLTLPKSGDQKLGALEQSISKYSVNSDELKKLADGSWLYPDIIRKGETTLFFAKPNTGKTQFFMRMASYLAGREFKPIYVNLDTSNHQMKHDDMVSNLPHKEFKILYPTFNHSGRDFLRDMESWAKHSSDMSKVVLFIDVVKMIVNPRKNEEIGPFIALCKKLNVRCGLTIVLQAHTNKYDDDEGNPIFEGTQDVLDLPHAAYSMQSFGALELPDIQILFVCKKSRARCERRQVIKFTLNEPDELTGAIADYSFQVLPHDEARHKHEMFRLSEAFKEEIPAIQDALRDITNPAERNQRNIISFVKERNVSEHRCRICLDALKDKEGYWFLEVGLNNAKLYVPFE